MAKYRSVLASIFKNRVKEVHFHRLCEPLEDFQDKITKSTRSFYDAIAKPGMSLIAEIKRKSPTERVIWDKEDDILDLGRVYEEAGASAVSVLTDRKYFGGRIEDLQEVSKRTKNVPILCKDFFVNRYQVYEARYFGADAILLMGAILTIGELDGFLEIARELGMEAICEAHSDRELEGVLRSTAKIVGVNCRDLHTMKIDPAATARLVSQIPSDRLIVAESALYSRQDVENLPKEVDGILVGTSILRAENPSDKIRELMGKNGS